MFAIKTVTDLNNLIELQDAVLSEVLGKSSDMRLNKYQWNLDLYKHKWTMIKVPVEVYGFHDVEETNMRLHFVRHYLKNSHSFLKSIVSPRRVSLSGKWIPFFMPGGFDFSNAVRLTNDNENILSGVSPAGRAFLECSINPLFRTEWMLEDIVSAIVWAKVQYNLTPETFNVDVFSASHAILHYVRKVLWSFANPKFKKAHA
ncbi:hypothetical protein JA13_296 [Dickeya phage vB_DsoM_JA13]|uniref:Uncharacterized protein n=1 Tax=Dickeya phage vB_DsoM_JA13 TaxID=2283030 RepID=A0A384ZWU6_9CAUD|nr:hypothetical protein JA13_296 [Dickeya phage vB_DsoM_JA13]